MPKIILAATTSATQSGDVMCVGNSLPAHFTCPGLAGSETGTVQKRNNDGTYSDYFVDGTEQQVTATNTGVVVYAPGVYRVDKTATAASVGVEVSTNETP